jgi:hypothetical protein
MTGFGHSVALRTFDELVLGSRPIYERSGEYRQRSSARWLVARGACGRARTARNCSGPQVLVGAAGWSVTNSGLPPARGPAAAGLVEPPTSTISKRIEEVDEVLLLLGGEADAEALIVEIDHIHQGRG